MKLQIRKKQGKVTIVGGKGEKYEQTLENINTAVKELGIDVQIEESKDKKLAKSYGARKLPAVITSTSQLKSSGDIPEINIIKEWLKGLV